MEEKNSDIHSGNWAKSIIKHGKWYLLSSVFVKGIAIFLLPIYTRYLSPEEYGLLSSLYFIGRLLPILISLYLDSAFGRFFHEKKHSPEQLKELFSTVYWFVLIYGCIILYLFLISSKFWVNDLLKVESWHYAYLAFIPCLFLQIGQLGLVFLRQSLKSKKTTFLEVTSTLIKIIITFPLLIGFKYGVFAPLWGIAFSALFLFSYYTIYFIRKKILVFKFNRVLLLSCLAYSVPLIPNIAGGWIAGLSDRLVIAKFIGLESVGVYSLGYQVAMIIYLLQDAITQVQGPISMSDLIHDKENTKVKV